MRGHFVQIESRMSQTGASADEWVPSGRGPKGLALGLAHVIMRDKLRAQRAAAGIIIGLGRWAAGLRAGAVEKLTGVRGEGRAVGARVCPARSGRWRLSAARRSRRPTRLFTVPVTR